MAKFLIYTDNHFSTTSSIVRSNGEEFSTRLENQIESINWAEQIAVEKGCSEVIHLGDFFDKPDLTSQELSALKCIKWNDLPHTFICGNHEMGSNDLRFNSLNALNKIGTVIDKPTIKSGYGYEILLLPYILESNRKPLKDYLDEARHEYWDSKLTTCEYKQSIILSHNDIAGVNYGQYVSKAGFSIKEIEDHCDLFLNGHLHNRSKVTEIIHNIGSLTGQNFTEDAYKYSHCAVVLDTEALSVEYIENPYALNFYKIEVNSIAELEEQLKELKPGKSIGTIKISEQYLKNARELCSKLFIEYRILTIHNTNAHNNSEQQSLTKIDHILQFGNSFKEKYGESDIINEELEKLRG